VLSIGSGDLQKPTRSSLWESLRSSKKRTFKLMNHRSEQTHKTMEKESYNGEAFEYFRLGVQADPALFSSNMSKASIKSRMQFDGIKPLRRSDSIRAATEEYLKTSHARLSLTTFARRLVDRRHERARDPQWETFAGVRYRCTQPSCKDRETLWRDRGRYMTHLEQVHEAKLPDMKNYREMQRKLDDGRVLLPMQVAVPSR